MSLSSNKSYQLEWLNILLKERVAPELELFETFDTNWLISVPSFPLNIIIPSWDLLWRTQTNNLPCVMWNAEIEGWKCPLAKPIPAPGMCEVINPLIELRDDRYEFKYDILGMAFWVMTRIEEIDNSELDDHNRFPATASHAYKHGYLDRPVVDEWFFILRQVVQRLCPQLSLVESKFSIRVSHDVDNPTRYAFITSSQLIRIIAGDVIKRKDVMTALRAPFLSMMPTKDRLNALDPYNTFDWIMDISDRYALKSAFYFICGRTNPVFDGDYEIEHPAIRHLLRHIHDRGHEIGIHPSYETYRQPELIKAEADRLRKVCIEEGITQSEWGGRMHFLRWETPTTLYGWEKAQMSYDSSLGYADLPGFRCGTCFEYQAFDPVKMESLNLRIRPLIAMECTIMAERYMGLGTEDSAYQEFIKLKNACKSVGGVFTLLWHNSQFIKQGERELYQKVISI